MRFRGKRREKKFAKYYDRMQRLVLEELCCNASRNRFFRAVKLAPPGNTIEKDVFVNCVETGQK